MGEPFEPDLAGIVAGLSPEEAFDALDDLLARDLVRPTAVPARFQFRHPLVRRAVYEGAPGGWRIAAHARAAAALTERGASPAERARHVEQSASRGNSAAIELLLEAGAATVGRAPTAAARWYGAALRLMPADDVAAQVLVRRQLASAQRAAGDLEGCRATLLDAIGLLPPGSGATQVELVARCAAVEHWLGRHEEAHDRLERAWAELGARGTVEAAVLEIELAVDALYVLDLDRARTRAAGALDSARALGRPALRAVAAAALALAEASGGHTANALEHRIEALKALEGLSDADLAPHHEVFHYLGWAENYLEHFEEAIAHADRGIAIARAAGSGRILVPLMLVKAFPLEVQGRIAECVELCETALEATELSDNPHFRYWALFELGWARHYAGDPDGAIEVCEEARQRGSMRGGTMPSATGGPGWCLATALLSLGETERALELLEEVAGPDLRHLAPVERCFGWEQLALAHIALGRLDRAEEYVRTAEETAVELELRLPFALAARARAALQLAAGHPEEAVLSARDSVADATAIGARVQAAFARHLLGQALAAAGDRTAAVAELREAEHELDACGSIRPRDDARRSLRKLGARAEPRGPATGADTGLESLTPREREIAELVTERKTNKQIAAALFLSDKTIESHLRNIFVKLGAGSRVDVALAVDRHRRAEA
jgi:DNA-binding NarL/FixJ family response regulator